MLAPADPRRQRVRHGDERFRFRSRTDEGAPHRKNRRWKVSRYEFGLETKDAVASARELAISALVGGLALLVITAIDLYD